MEHDVRGILPWQIEFWYALKKWNTHEETRKNKERMKKMKVNIKQILNDGQWRLEEKKDLLWLLRSGYII